MPDNELFPLAYPGGVGPYFNDEAEAASMLRPVYPMPLVEPVVSNEFVVPDADLLALRQRYAESTFNDSAKSPAGAMGAYQIMPKTLKAYIDATGNEGDVMDYAYNKAIRDWYLDSLGRSQTITRGEPTEAVRLAKQFAAYNWGPGNLGNYLQKRKDGGEDIYHSTGWIDGLPDETKNYVNWIVFGKDVPNTQLNKAAFDSAYSAFQNKSNGGELNLRSVDKDKLADLATRISDFGYEYKKGGKIYIKPSHRGKFTALKKRTGHSASWFKAHGTPAQKKMATFALNARKWKHADGGFLVDVDI